MNQSDNDKTQSHVPLSSGTLVSHYRIIERIGAGGMGEVYLAEDTKLDRKVALKFLPLHLCPDADCRARFTREAQAAAKLNHPSIVTIYEVGDFNGRPFFAMEHLEGQSLRDLIKQNSIPLSQTIQIAIQLCEGLQEAHSAGIVHRDIKPSNAIIDKKGRCKLLDFGLASLRGSEHLTKTGSTLGTVGYMSPEQARGEEVDARSDLFSLGIALYELIAGRAPFKAESEVATVRNIVEAVPEPLARFKADVPDELQRIVSKALTKDKNLRYQHADDLLTDLRALSRGDWLSQQTRRSRGSRMRYAVAALAAVIVLIAAYWVVKTYVKGSGSAVSGRKLLAVLPFENLGSPDDEYFADGITDEITAKLAAVHDLGVISRTSTILYKHTTKNLKQIASELGVDYVLEGTVLWEKGRDTSRVRILPQLIQVSNDTHLWAETYERPLTGIFAVQADIATRIAEAMDIALLGPEHTAVEFMPTRNLDAYQAYLRGLSIWQDLDATMDNCQVALQMFQRAVDLDTTFALAYAKLSIVNAGLFQFGYDATPNRLAQAKAAADRALAIQPNLPQAHIALCYYYYWGRWDYDRALGELAQAEIGLPNDPEILRTKAFIWRRQGRFQEALKLFERLFVLNPRDKNPPNELGTTYQMLGDYVSAEKYLDQSISLGPDQFIAYAYKAENYYAWRGNIVAARQALAKIPRQDNNDVRLLWFWQHIYERDYDSALSVLSLFSGAGTAGSQESYYSRNELEGMVYDLMREPERARACYDSARVILEHAVAERPDDYRIHSSLGTIYAGLDRKADAIREGKLSVELLPVSKDAALGPAAVLNLALIYVMVDNYDEALNQAEYLLSIPSGTSMWHFRLDPRFDPLRKLPRYQKLLEKYGT